VHNIINDIYVAVSEFKGKHRVDIRKYFDAGEGEMKPTQKGINMTVEQWTALVEKLPEMQAYIEKELE